MNPILYVLSGLLLILACVVSAGSAYAQEMPPTNPTEKRHSNMDTRLADMYDASTTGQAARNSGITGTGNLMVQVILEMINADVGVPQGLGILVETTYGNLVQATVPIRNLEAIASHDAVHMIKMPARPYHTHHIISEGVDMIGADVANASGYTGSGVKVAVIDTGFDISEHEIAGNIAEHRSFWHPHLDISGISKDDTDHGTAVAEVIVDVAPDAELYLYNSGTAVEFFNLVDHIVQRGDIDIVVMSIAWPGAAQPADGTSNISGKVDQAKDSGILWINSAGNYAAGHWQGQFSDPDGNGWHNFQGSDESIDIDILAYQELEVWLSWDDWDDRLQDYDLCLLEDGDELICSAGEQGDGYPPHEYLWWISPYDTTVNISIHKYSATRDVNFQLFSNYDLNEYAVAESSIVIPADATGSLTVGAVNAGSGQLEPYSSQGPTLDGRIKPDIVAPSAVTTSAYGFTEFHGTSASAPYAAGSAALLVQKYPDATPDFIRHALESTASNHHSKSNLDGAGLINAAQSLEFLASPATITHAAITGPNMITIKFSEAVTLTAASFTDFKLTGGAGISGEVRQITSISSADPDTVMIAIAGDAMPPGATGRIDISGVRDAAGIELAPLDDYAVTDGQTGEPTTMITDLTLDSVTELHTLMVALRAQVEALQYQIGNLTERVRLLESSPAQPPEAEPESEPLLSGVVYYDANGNGIHDAGEPPVPNATVLTVDLTDFAKVVRVTTDISGLYEFTDLAPGGYLVQVEGHAGQHAYAYLDITDTTVHDLGTS